MSPNPHAEVARACLAFLSFDDFSNKPCGACVGQRFHEYRIPPNKSFHGNPYHFTFYAILSWAFHAQKAGETEEVQGAAFGFLSRPGNVAYNWLVIIIEKHRTGRWEHYQDVIIYEDMLEDADLFRLLLPVHFGLLGVLVELLKRYTRPAENTLDTVISRLACHAARRRHKEIVRLLLTQDDVDWDMCDMGGEHLLSLVDEDNIRTLVHKENCSVNASSKKGSALHAAVWNSELSRVQTLLEAGADVGGLDNYGWPVITKAIDAGIVKESWGEMMDLLLQCKADINAHTVDGFTAIHFAARGPFFGSALEYLVSKGANPNLPTGLGKTPLDIAEESAAESSRYYTGRFKRCDYEKVIQILRKAGGKTAKEMTQSSIGEQGPSFPSEWLERLKDIQDLKFSFDRANSSN